MAIDFGFKTGEDVLVISEFPCFQQLSHEVKFYHLGGKKTELETKAEGQLYTGVVVLQHRGWNKMPYTMGTGVFVGLLWLPSGCFSKYSFFSVVLLFCGKRSSRLILCYSIISEGLHVFF